MDRILAAIILAAALPASGAQKIAVITSGDFPPPARHGLSKLKSALAANGAVVVTSTGPADAVLLVGSGYADTLKAWNAPLPRGRESLTIQHGKFEGKPAVVLCGSDATGLMYAELEAAERISWTQPDAPD